MQSKERWTVGKVLIWAKGFLEKKGVSAHQREAEEMLSSVLNLDRVGLYTSLDRPMDEKELHTYKEMLKRRIKGEPLQYITGFEQFWKYRFKVGPEVLIPRPETEVLVAQAIGFLDQLNEDTPLICDVGTGSGAILLSILADRPQTQGIGTDVSLPALKVAHENSELLKVNERCQLVCTSLMDALRQEERFNLITANMPYVKTDEIQSLQQEVKREPITALNGGKDGLFWISKLVIQAPRYLKRGGMLAIELAPEQREKALLLFKGRGLGGIKVVEDQWGRSRVITAIKE